MAGALWSDILQVGKFDHVVFDFVRSTLEGGNTLDQQIFPNMAGTTVQGRGRNGRRFSVLGIFIEDDYPDTMNALIAKLENGGVPKEFVDPVFGSMLAACDTFSVAHDAEEAADSATIQINFIEHAASAQGPLAITNTTPARANAVRAAITDVLVALSAFEEATEVQNNPYALEVTGAINAANGIADELEATGDDLTAPDIQTQANVALSTCDAAVATGADYDSPEAYDLGQALLAMAAAVQGLAQDLIEAKPPLQVYVVPADTNLLAFAHDLYGDSSRADEVLGLNSIPDPSLIPAGFRMSAYGA
jgi:prophage DNA circulation protein